MLNISSSFPFYICFYSTANIIKRNSSRSIVNKEGTTVLTERELKVFNLVVLATAILITRV